jgi:hypothetical protein
MAKDKAFKPCDKKSSHHSLQNRNHKVHMLLNSCSKNSQVCIHIYSYFSLLFIEEGF